MSNFLCLTILTSIQISIVTDQSSQMNHMTDKADTPRSHGVEKENRFTPQPSPLSLVLKIQQALSYVMLDSLMHNPTSMHLDLSLI